MPKSAKKTAANKNAKKKDQTAPEKLRLLVDSLSYEQGPNPKSVPLTNLTFWAGAGFSKAWEPEAPIGSKLFELSNKILASIADPLVFSRVFGIEEFKGIDMDDLRQIVYVLDMNERYPDIQSRYIDANNIEIFRARLRAAVITRYNELAKLNYLDESTSKFECISPTASQSAILRMFQHLHGATDGSQTTVEGLRFHFITTNYDFVIETILDNLIGHDDSLFLYSYRGVTPNKISGKLNPVVAHQHWLTQHLIKINGGFEIIRDGQGYSFEYQARSASDIEATPPILMLPSREQSYSDPYFKSVFSKAIRLMRESMILVIIGYSLPDDDALMRFIIRQFAEEPEDARLKYLFYIDLNTREEKMSKLRSVYPLIDTFEQRIITYEGSFSDFAKEYAKLLPKGDDFL